MSFAKSTKTETLTVTLTPEHIRQTLAQEIVRRKYSDSLYRGAGNVCAPDRTYCSSCPVANAIWELLDGPVASIEVDGFGVDVTFSSASITRSEPGADLDSPDQWWYYGAPLSEEVSRWIRDFDAWLAPTEEASGTVEHAEGKLASPEEWPAVPAPFTLTFENHSYAGV